ncbi:tetratricopeptide (TPR) repeat protein [Duganella sp. SG902]|uniref:tetratricopeptide repeat protein n=1 Tax=Duganella sp. SG902 TaxID=2587016 RepID=UPI00159D36D7|nr:hypothetical protein [Duganella sp. SG902]NVM75250.1 tetratricopeptide (TPR) repeat protein [Duganella sp. SG902]
MKFERPQSDHELEVILRAAYDLALKSQSTEALALCSWLIEESTTSVAGHRQRAAVFEYQGNVSDAISDMEFVTSHDPGEPADFHALGILYFKLGGMAKAEAAFTASLELSKAVRNTHYKNSCHLFRAAARLKLTHYQEALADAQALPDQYSTHMPGVGMRSKEHIVVEAERELSRMARRNHRAY